MGNHSEIKKVSEDGEMNIKLVNGKYTVNDKIADEMNEKELAFLWDFFKEYKQQLENK